MSTFTHSFHIFLPLPLLFVPSTCNSLHADTQSLLSLSFTILLILVVHGLPSLPCTVHKFSQTVHQLCSPPSIPQCHTWWTNFTEPHNFSRTPAIAVDLIQNEMQQNSDHQMQNSQIKQFHSKVKQIDCSTWQLASRLIG